MKGLIVMQKKKYKGKPPLDMAQPNKHLLGPQQVPGPRLVVKKWVLLKVSEKKENSAYTFTTSASKYLH